MITTLSVNQSELAQALKTLRKFIKRGQKDEAVFSLTDGMLTIDIGGITVKATASGKLHGQACIRWAYLIGVANVVPTEDPVVFRFEDNRLVIGSTSLPCIWQEVVADVIDLPMNPPLPIVLNLRGKYTDEHIARSGLTGVVFMAEERMHKLIDEAASTLAELGVSRVDVERVVEHALARAPGTGTSGDVESPDLM